ncbi:hypothetical protein FisN_22Lh011 [Fistulifera solaris]|uniref:Uncharacterized protein n=1 Tax=Fistulifera solaris TaxID=1519565 RepID=A0A1Z5JBR4_FISSO|nr:hypothetical protein FisN_22Lh011 [Fistulifera solaris]|eukprot:GAX11342.1 hypothetical protein FisN_22Lh011 [Fistulifera solaris]
MNHYKRLIRSRASLAMNEQGLMLLRNLDYEEAITFFHGGLETLLEEHQCCPVDDVKFSSKSADLLRAKASDDKASFGLATRTNLLMSASYSLDTIQEIHNEILTLFNKPLSLRVELLDEVWDDDVVQNLLIGVYFYNAGLAFHLQALASNSSESMSKAAEHYAISYARFLYCSFYNGKDVDATLGLLVTSNNIAHIHAFCRNMEQVEVCVEELASKLSNFVTQSGDTHHVNNCRMFLQNVCYFQESVFLSAPAA